MRAVDRDMMITAHQNQIEQLRESFRTRSVEIEMWPIKVLNMSLKGTKHGTHEKV